MHPFITPPLSLATPCSTLLIVTSHLPLPQPETEHIHNPHVRLLSAMPATYSSPHHALTLPPTSFTVPPTPLHIVSGEAASYGAEETPGESSGRPRNALKVTFRPTLQVPSALVGSRVIGRKVEECFDVVVPIGARVGLRVDVVNAPHSLLGEEDDYLDDELGTRDQVHAHIIELIERVRSQILLLC